MFKEIKIGPSALQADAAGVCRFHPSLRVAKVKQLFNELEKRTGGYSFRESNLINASKILAAKALCVTSLQFSSVPPSNVREVRLPTTLAFVSLIGQIVQISHVLRGTLPTILVFVSLIKFRKVTPISYST